MLNGLHNVVCSSPVVMGLWGNHFPAQSPCQLRMQPYGYTVSVVCCRPKIAQFEVSPQFSDRLLDGRQRQPSKGRVIHKDRQNDAEITSDRDLYAASEDICSKPIDHAMVRIFRFPPCFVPYSDFLSKQTVFFDLPWEKALWLLHIYSQSI